MQFRVVLTDFNETAAARKHAHRLRIELWVANSIFPQCRAPVRSRCFDLEVRSLSQTRVCLLTMKEADFAQFDRFRLRPCHCYSTHRLRIESPVSNSIFPQCRATRRRRWFDLEVRIFLQGRVCLLTSLIVFSLENRVEKNRFSLVHVFAYNELNDPPYFI